MLIDKKREQMYERCREEKNKLDKNMAGARAILMLPPAYLLLSALFDTIISFLGEAAIIVASAGNEYAVIGASIVNLFSILGGGGLFYFVALLTVFKNPIARRHIVTVNVAAALIFTVLAVGFGYFELLAFTGYCIIAIPISYWNETLIKKDESMSTLDGYPHFNIAMIKHTESPKVEYTKEQLAEMDDYDRIMLERDGKL